MLTLIITENYVQLARNLLGFIEPLRWDRNVVPKHR